MLFLFIQQMVTDLISLFSNLVRAAFLPESLENIAQETRDSFGKWPCPCSDIPGGWLPSSVRYIRSASSIYLSVYTFPMKVLQLVIKKLHAILMINERILWINSEDNMPYISVNFAVIRFFGIHFHVAKVQCTKIIFGIVLDNFICFFNCKKNDRSR